MSFPVDVWQWLLNVTGDKVAGTRWNLFWSGFGSAGVITTGIFTGAYHSVKAANCHNRGCWRIGHHPLPTGHKVCKVHVAKPLSELNLHEVHPDHQA